MLKISFFETRSRFFLFLSRFLRRDRDFCFPYLVFRDKIEIFAFLISFFETRSRFFLSLSRFSRRFETKSRAKSHEIFRDRDISLGSGRNRPAALTVVGLTSCCLMEGSGCSLTKVEQPVGFGAVASFTFSASLPPTCAGTVKIALAPVFLNQPDLSGRPPASL